MFIVAINLASALSLYWFVGALVAIWQQSRILKQDVQEMEAVVDGAPAKAEIMTQDEPSVKIHKKTGVKTYIKQEQTTPPKTKNTKNKTAKNRSKSKKRR